MNIKQTLFATSAVIIAGVVAVSTGATAQTASNGYSADTVAIDHFIGNIEVRTGSSSRVTVAITNPGDLVEDPTVSNASGTLTIDGGESMRNLRCSSRNNNVRIGRSRLNMHDIEDYPTLVITAPADIAFNLRRSAFVGQSGDLGSLEMSMSSCGRFEGGNIAGAASISINGSGDITVGSIGSDADVDINGSGDVIFTNVSGNARVGINGSGDVQSGDISGDADVSINGSGDVEFGTVAGLEIGISGSGDVKADSMNGAFDARINGSGDIRVRGGRAEPFGVNIGGSGDVSFDGTAVNVTVREGGSGDVRIDNIEGTVRWSRHGRTVLRVGDVD